MITWLEMVSISKERGLNFPSSSHSGLIMWGQAVRAVVVEHTSCVLRADS